MENINLTPDEENYSSKKNKSIRTNNKKSIIFKDVQSSLEYIEIVNEEKNFIKIIFRSQEEINSKNAEINQIMQDKLSQFKEFSLIFDFQRLSIELETEDLNKIINKFLDSFSQDCKINLIIKNSLINDEKKLTPIQSRNKLIFNKLEIHDELYSLSTKLDDLFPSIEVNELILKKFKFNSKNQISNFFKFIRKVNCKKLTLEDIFVELIIKSSENDEEYKDLDIYIAYVDDIITLDNTYTHIESLTMRDCPLFAIIGNMFTYNKNKKNIDIDIDETSLINPFIITRFKIIKGKFELCFDLDSFKLQLEEKGYKNDYDYIDYLDYIFYIVIGFEREGQKIIKDKTKWDEDEDGLTNINRENFYKLTFKNFDTNKFEFITDDEITFIEEKNWILNKEEKVKKERWEKLEQDLKNFEFNNLDNVKELVFDNCSNFFIKWIIYFIKGENDFNKSNNKDFELLKIKKCGKDYVNLEKILTYKINKLILFDDPLIIGDKFPEKGALHLDIIKNKLGSIDNLTLKNNSLDCYGKEYNLNTNRTYEIYEELIKNQRFNKNITFELSALSFFMTFLAYREYCKNQINFYDTNDEEDGLDYVRDKGNIKGILNEKDKIKDPGMHLPKQIFFSSKRKRDSIYPIFKDIFDENSKITLKNLTIKKQTENFDNQNYLIYKKNKSFKPKSYTDNNDLKKIDFGSDGFFIDRDYKNFFSYNKIETVELRNVVFSNYKDNNLKDIEGETITNLISNNEFEEDSISNNNYQKTHFPNYKIDVKTLNGILYKNYLFEDISVMFKYFLYRIEDPKMPQDKAYPVNVDIYEKKSTLMEYFQKFKGLFEYFNSNKKKLTIIINNIKELKEFCCTLCVLRLLLNEKKYVKEKLTFAGNKNNFNEIKLPDKKEMEYEIGAFFLKEKNEDEKDCYSELNYYYISEEEETIIKKKAIKIDKYEFGIEYDFDIFEEIA